MQFEPAANDGRDFFQYLCEIATRFLLHENRGYQRHHRDTRHPGQQAEHRPADIVAIVDITEHQFKFFGDRIRQFVCDKFYGSPQRMPRLQRSFDRVYGVR